MCRVDFILALSLAGFMHLCLVADTASAQDTAQDLRLLVSGNDEKSIAAMYRLANHGEAAVPGLVALLQSPTDRERGLAAWALMSFDPKEATGAQVAILAAMGTEQDVGVLEMLLICGEALRYKEHEVLDHVAPQLEQGGEASRMVLDYIYGYEGDYAEVTSSAISGLSSNTWNGERRRLLRLLEESRIGPTEIEALSQVTLGEIPRYTPAPNAVVESPENREFWDWLDSAEFVSRELFADPEAYLVFLRSNPSALSVFRDNEPWFVYLFAAAEPETKTLRDYLLAREDMFSVVDIDLAQGERVGTIAVHALPGRAVYPLPGRSGEINVVVCGDRYHLNDSSIPDGYHIEFQSERARIDVDGVVGFIDPEGAIVIAPVFDEARPFSSQQAWVCQDGKWGKVDPDGQVVIEPIYDDVAILNNSVDRVEVDGQVGLVLKSGAVFVEPAYRRISYDPSSRTYLVTSPDGTHDTIDAEGNFVPNEYRSRLVPPQ